MSQAGGEWCHCLRANPSAIFFVFSKRALPEQEAGLRLRWRAISNIFAISNASQTLWLRVW